MEYLIASLYVVFHICAVVVISLLPFVLTVMAGFHLSISIIGLIVGLVFGLAYAMWVSDKD